MLAHNTSHFVTQCLLVSQQARRAAACPFSVLVTQYQRSFDGSAVLSVLILAMISCYFALVHWLQTYFEENVTAVGRLCRALPSTCVSCALSGSSVLETVL